MGQKNAFIIYKLNLFIIDMKTFTTAELNIIYVQQVKKELKLDKSPKYWKKIQPVWRRVLIQYKKYAKQKIKKPASIKRS